ncbi:hypothetical protein RRG08_007140, partial [Elysia crispata]
VGDERSPRIRVITLSEPSDPSGRDQRGMDSPDISMCRMYYLLSFRRGGVVGRVTVQRPVKLR